jgi:hypothetical protein
VVGLLTHCCTDTGTTSLPLQSAAQPPGHTPCYSPGHTFIIATCALDPTSLTYCSSATSCAVLCTRASFRAQIRAEVSRANPSDPSNEGGCSSMPLQDNSREKQGCKQRLLIDSPRILTQCQMQHFWSLIQQSCDALTVPLANIRSNCCPEVWYSAGFGCCQCSSMPW